MNIIFDLDNTLFYNNIVDNMCALHSVARGLRHDLNDMREDIRNACFEQFGNIDAMCNLQPFAGAVGIDKRLTDMGHNVYVVTARDDSMLNETVAMVKKHFPYVKEVFLAGSYTKYYIYETLDADIVVDDHFAHINEAITLGVDHVVMVSNPYTPYNHEYKSCVINKGGVIVRNVEEFFGLVVEGVFE